MQRVSQGTLQKTLAEHFSLPEDVACGSFLIWMIGNSGLRIENHRGLLQFTDSCLLLGGKHMNLRITGQNLTVRLFQQEVIEICGTIYTISWEGEHQ